MPCTTILVGKNASNDGSTMIARTDDGHFDVKKVETNGKRYSERVDFPKGEPENPLSEEEFYSRYADLMAYGDIEKSVYDEVYKHVNKSDIKVEELIEKL